MEPIEIMAIVGFIIFIIVQVHQLIRDIRFYKELRKNHDMFIQSLRGGEYNVESSSDGRQNKED